MSGGGEKDYNHAERLLWQNPNRILLEIGLATGQTLVDIGCGDGFFSIPAAKIVGKAGLVYAIDTSPEAIVSLTAKAQVAQLDNICPLLTDIALEPPPCCVDIALLANVLHCFKNPLVVLANIKRVLRPNGVLAVLDWKKEPQQRHGPALPKRLSQEAAVALIQQSGFRVVKDAPSGPFHYLVLAQQNSVG